MLLVSCSDNSTGANGGSGDDNGNSDSSTGTVEVTTATSGNDQDNSYTIVVGNNQENISANETITINDVDEGSYDAELTDVAENCSVDGSNPKSVDVTAGETTTVSYDISCEAKTGSIEVTTSTSGQNPDMNGYTIAVANQEKDIGIDETIIISGIEEGDYDAELKDVASNCSVEGDNPRQVTISYADTSSTTYEVGCQSAGSGDSGGGKIVFYSDRTEDRQIFIMNGDGSNVTNLTPNTQLNINPVISPDGTKILFSSGRDGQGFKLFTMNPDGSDVTEIADFQQVNTLREPSYSPDGSKIIFNGYDDDGGSSLRDIFVMDADGTNLNQLTNNSSAVDLNQVWSPNGDRIAFTSGRDGDAEIYTMKPDGSDVQQLTNNSYPDATPAWSPDGSKIAYASSPNEYADIYVMDADGSNKTKITDNPETDEFPSWSPDGSEIVFESQRDEGTISEIYKIAADGSGSAIRLTTSNNNPPYGSDSDPYWGTITTGSQ
jgi:Tol biopolymer transport system component